MITRKKALLLVAHDKDGTLKRVTSSFPLVIAVYLLAAMLLQVLRVPFGDSPYLSALNQIALLGITFYVVRFIPSVREDVLLAIFVSTHLILLWPLVFHVLSGKRLEVLVLGHLDNLKFILPLTIFLLVKRELWSINAKAQKIIKALWYFIFLGVLFGLLQEFLPDVAIAFSSSDEARLQYRHGILRVPSYFGEINAFARASFLLIPLAILLGEKVLVSVLMALLGMLLAFSRQFILGVFLSAGLAAFFIIARRLRFFAKISLLSLAVSGLFLIYLLGNLAFVAAGDDDKILTISERYIRTAVAETSLSAVADRPFTGVGPGYFGGNIGKKFGVTEDLYGYGLLEKVPYFDLLGAHYTDTLWPQLLAEYGLLGAVSFSMLLFLWFRRISFAENLRFRFAGYLCFFQFVFAASVSPVFNFLYFSMAILVLSLFLAESEASKVSAAT